MASEHRQLLEWGFTIKESRGAAEPLIARLGRETSPENLVPKKHDSSRAWSHSDKNGFNAFPWHTDGAIALDPPRWMILQCAEASHATETHLLDLDTETFVKLRRSTMRVRNEIGQVRHLPAASPISGGRFRLRWDPRICELSDDSLAERIEELPPSATCIWSVGRTLIVDNWRLLHKRPGVDPDSSRRLIRTYVRQP